MKRENLMNNMEEFIQKIADNKIFDNNENFHKMMPEIIELVFFEKYNKKFFEICTNLLFRSQLKAKFGLRTRNIMMFIFQIIKRDKSNRFLKKLVNHSFKEEKKSYYEKLRPSIFNNDINMFEEEVQKYSRYSNKAELYNDNSSSESSVFMDNLDDEIITTEDIINQNLDPKRWEKICKRVYYNMCEFLKDNLGVITDSSKIDPDNYKQHITRIIYKQSKNWKETGVSMKRLKKVIKPFLIIEQMRKEDISFYQNYKSSKNDNFASLLRKFDNIIDYIRKKKVENLSSYFEEPNIKGLVDELDSTIEELAVLISQMNYIEYENAYSLYLDACEKLVKIKRNIILGKKRNRNEKVQQFNNNLSIDIKSSRKKRADSKRLTLKGPSRIYSSYHTYNKINSNHDLAPGTPMVRMHRKLKTRKISTFTGLSKSKKFDFLIGKSALEKVKEQESQIDSFTKFGDILNESYYVKNTDNLADLQEDLLKKKYAGIVKNSQKISSNLHSIKGINSPKMLGSIVKMKISKKRTEKYNEDTESEEDQIIELKNEYRVQNMMIDYEAEKSRNSPKKDSFEVTVVKNKVPPSIKIISPKNKPRSRNINLPDELFNSEVRPSTQSNNIIIKRMGTPVVVLKTAKALLGKTKDNKKRGQMKQNVLFRSKTNQPDQLKKNLGFTKTLEYKDIQDEHEKLEILRNVGLKNHSHKDDKMAEGWDPFEIDDLDVENSVQKVMNKNFNPMVRTMKQVEKTNQVIKSDKIIRKLHVPSARKFKSVEEFFNNFESDKPGFSMKKIEAKEDQSISSREEEPNLLKISHPKLPMAIGDRGHIKSISSIYSPKEIIEPADETLSFLQKLRMKDGSLRRSSLFFKGNMKNFNPEDHIIKSPNFNTSKKKLSLDSKSSEDFYTAEEIESEEDDSFSDSLDDMSIQEQDLLSEASMGRRDYKKTIYRLWNMKTRDEKPIKVRNKQVYINDKKVIGFNPNLKNGNEIEECEDFSLKFKSLKFKNGDDQFLSKSNFLNTTPSTNQEREKMLVELILKNKSDRKISFLYIRVKATKKMIIETINFNKQEEIYIEEFDRNAKIMISFVLELKEVTSCMPHLKLEYCFKSTKILPKKKSKSFVVPIFFYNFFKPLKICSSEKFAYNWKMRKIYSRTIVSEIFVSKYKLVKDLETLKLIFPGCVLIDVERGYKISKMANNTRFRMKFFTRRYGILMQWRGIIFQLRFSVDNCNASFFEALVPAKFDEEEQSRNRLAVFDSMVYDEEVYNCSVSLIKDLIFILSE